MSAEERLKNIERILEEKINPAIARQGAVVEAAKLEDGTLHVRILGQGKPDLILRAVKGSWRTPFRKSPRLSARRLETAGDAGDRWAEDEVQKIRELFDGHINPALAGHGGFAEVLDVRGNNLFIRIGGGCQGCGMASVTVKQGIQGLIARMYPDLQVIDTTDHASGTNPYYSPARAAARTRASKREPVALPWEPSRR
ncbi:MAG: NifU family protein [Deltaproteobacteria bacterium]|nr:NifU family protein [Deltaproteobacteria bacterium]